MKAFDAHCHECGQTHVMWVPWGHDEGDEIGMAHQLDGNFLHYGKHTLKRQLDGLSDMDKWSKPDSADA